MGLLLGFPLTAVEAYNSDLSLDFENFFKHELAEKEKGKLKEENILKFLNFQPSKKHWKKELNKVRKNKIFIEEKFPEFYEKIKTKSHQYDKF